MITQTLRYATLGLLFLIVFIPLYVNNSYFFPFITGKAFAFRILVEIALALWLLLVLRDKKYAPRFSKISLAVTLFTIAILITDLLGLNPIRSIWSNFERMEGWVTLAHLWAYFIVATSLFGAGEEGKRMWHNLMKTSLVAASIVGIYGFFQLFGWAEIHQGSSRIDASLGNAAYMAVYMLMHSFIAFYLGLVSYERRNKGAMWWFIILGLIFGYLLFETATRGTILGWAGGVMLAFGIFALFGRGESKKARWISFTGIAIIVLLAIGIVAAKDTSFIKGNETLHRLATISWSESKTQARGYIWPMAVNDIFSSPKTAVIGVGQENFNYIFNANYNPKMWGHEQWFDRAHNVFLDWLVAGGLVGFILYVSLFVLAIIALWKSTLSFREKALLTGLFVGYAIHNIFVFDNLVSYILFFTLLGFAHTLSAGNPLSWLEVADDQTENQLVVRDYIYYPVILILFVATFYFVNVRPIQANTRLIAAMTSCSGGTTPSSELFAKSLKLNQPVANQEIREQLIGCAAPVLRGGYPLEVKNGFYTLTTSEIQRQIESNPNDARGYIIGGSFYNNIGEWDKGLPLLEKANELSPNKQSIIFELATNYLNSGREKEASVLLEKAYLSAPENETAKVGYASTLILTGEEAKAMEILKDNPELVNDPRIISVYVRSGQYQKAIDILKNKIQKNPDNIENYSSLASLYLQMGRKDLSISLLESIVDKFPPFKEQIEKAIEQIKSSE